MTSKNEITRLEERLEEKPGDVSLKLELARTYLEAGMYDMKAAHIYEEVSQTETAPSEMHKALSICYLLKEVRDLSFGALEIDDLPQKYIAESARKITSLHREYPHSFDILIALAELYLVEGNYKKAVKSYTSALSNCGRSKACRNEIPIPLSDLTSVQDDELFAFADIARELKNVSTERKLLSELVARGHCEKDILSRKRDVLENLIGDRRPEDIPEDLIKEIVDIYIQLEEDHKALRYLEHADISTFKEPSLVMSIVKILIDQEDFRRAFDYLSQVEPHGKTVTLLNEITEKLEERGELDTATYLLQYINKRMFQETKPPRKDNLEIDTLIEMGDQHARTERYSLALEKYVDALKAGHPNLNGVMEKIEDFLASLDKESTPHLAYIAGLLRAREDFSSAVMLLKKVVTLEPFDDVMTQNLRSLYDTLLKDHPDMSELRLDSGDLYFLRGEIDLAIGEYKLAAESPESRLKANRRLARAYIQNHNYQFAVEKYKNIPIDNEDLDELYDLHLCLLDEGLMTEALTAATLIYDYDSQYRDIEKKLPELRQQTKNRKEDLFIDPKMRELIGEVAIGRYKYIEKLGGGGMGMVYKVFDIKQQRPVAMKILRETLSSSEKAIERFFREARIAGALNHPNIANIFDYNISKAHGKSFIAMEYVEGTSLRTIIEKKFEDDSTLEGDYLTECLDYVSQICNALDATHAKGIIHRDIKPDNILLSDDRRVKITDFGIVHIEEATFTPTGAMIGTPRYMSPEQVRGGRIDNRSDIYSVGITLYELLIGCPPFISGDIAYQHINVVPTPPVDIKPETPRSVNEIVVKCLEKEPSKRYQDAIQLKTDIDNALKELGGFSKETTTLDDTIDEV